MKTQFINKLVSQPLNLDPLRARAWIASAITTLRSERPAEDVFGDPLPKMQIVEDWAIIPVTGVLKINVPEWVKRYGLNLTDMADIEEELMQAASDSRISRIVLDIDSPGGWSVAGNKFFDAVDAARQKKPVFAWCADGNDMASAAYQGGAAANMILTGANAMGIGSIGSYIALLDDTELWKMMGITIEVIRSGEIKGAGEDGYSEAQIAFYRETTLRFADRFKANVRRYRTALPPEEMEGQFYEGAEAARRGFTHGTAPDLRSAMARFRAQSL